MVQWDSLCLACAIQQFLLLAPKGALKGGVANCGIGAERNATRNTMFTRTWPRGKSTSLKSQALLKDFMVLIKHPSFLSTKKTHEYQPGCIYNTPFGGCPRSTFGFKRWFFLHDSYLQRPRHTHRAAQLLVNIFQAYSSYAPFGTHHSPSQSTQRLPTSLCVYKENS